MKRNGSTCIGRLGAAVSRMALAPKVAPTNCLKPPMPTSVGVRTFRRWSAAALSALGMTVIAPPSAGYAQAPPLGTLANFAILAGAGITNTGPSVISGIPAHPGDLGSTTATIGGFPPGIVVPPAIIHPINDGPTSLAHASLVTAYNNLAGRTPTMSLTGQNLGGLTLIPGVYEFSSTAQLTGTLRLNGLGNPNSIFIFNIGSTLTTASASVVSLLNGAQGGNVFWRVGSSATLGSSTSFAGDILALASISLDTNASINCGAAWAQTGAVTLDTNVISICALIGGGGTPVGPTGVPLFTGLLPSNASANQIAVAAALDGFIANGGLLSPALLALFNLSPSDLANALSQLSGELGTGVAQAGTQAMNSFLSLLADRLGGFGGAPFGAPVHGGPPLIVKGYAPENPQSPARGAFASFDRSAYAGIPDQRGFGVWAAGYGDRGSASGDAILGSHDRSARTYGYATGLDYRLTPNSVVGFALAGGGTRYSLSDGLGSGSSDMFQAAVYGAARFGAAYLSGALAYAWHQVSTSRYVTILGTDNLTADFSAYNFGGRVETGYRFSVSGSGRLGQYGITPYAALQMQSFHTPSYGESAVSGSSLFALNYDARTTRTTRTELGSRFDWSVPIDANAVLTLRSRAAWAHDNWTAPSVNAMFPVLPGTNFTVFGAAPARDYLLASAGAEISLANGLSFAAWFDGGFAENAQSYAGTGRLRYIW